MVTPREIVTTAQTRREEISAMLNAENISQFSCSTGGTKSFGIYVCEGGTVFGHSVLRKRTVTSPSGQRTFRTSS